MRHRSVDLASLVVIRETFSKTATIARCFKRKLENFPAIFKQNMLYLCKKVPVSLFVTIQHSNAEGVTAKMHSQEANSAFIYICRLTLLNAKMGLQT